MDLQEWYSYDVAATNESETDWLKVAQRSAQMRQNCLIKLGKGRD